MKADERYLWFLAVWLRVKRARIGSAAWRFYYSWLCAVFFGR